MHLTLVATIYCTKTLRKHTTCYNYGSHVHTPIKEFTVRIQQWADIAGLRDAEMIERIFTAMHGEIAMEALGTLGRSNEQVNYFSHPYSLEDLGKRLVIIRDALYTMV